MAKNERLTVKCLVDFPNLWEPRKIMDQGKPVYSATLIIPKTNETFINKLREICNKLSETDARLKDQQFVHFPLIDGDATNSDGEFYPERYHGCFILRAKSNFPPHLFEYNGITDMYRELNYGDERVFAGMEAKVNISVFAYAVGGNRGISVGLGDMCITGKGEPFYNNDPHEKFGSCL